MVSIAASTTGGSTIPMPVLALQDLLARANDSDLAWLGGLGDRHRHGQHAVLIGRGDGVELDILRGVSRPANLSVGRSRISHSTPSSVRRLRWAVMVSCDPSTLMSSEPGSIPARSQCRM
jgi:hypothetical protein